MAADILADARTGKNGRHALVGLLRQSVFGRLAGYEDVNDAERLRHDPAMRFVGGKAAQRSAASPSHMGRFETHFRHCKTAATGKFGQAAIPIQKTLVRLPAGAIHHPI
jgi:hypothetical protein